MHEAEKQAKPTVARPRFSLGVPALILGKGVTALAVMRCLARRQITQYVTPAPGDLISRSRCYKPLHALHSSDPTEEDLGVMLEALDVNRMVLIPCSDSWAMSVSRLPPAVAKRFPGGTVGPGILEKLVDKSAFADTLRDVGIPHPRTLVLRGQNALNNVPEDLLRSSFLKPTQSGPFTARYGKKGFQFTHRDDAIRFLHEAHQRGFELMLQEYIPGLPTQHYFVEGFIDHYGSVCGLFARRRIRMFPQMFGNSTSTESIPLRDVADASTHLLHLLDSIGYRGVFSAEFKLDERDGLFKILEVNARPWWFVGFAASCGVDVCHMAYLDALGEDIKAVSEYVERRSCVYTHLDLEADSRQPKTDRESRGSLRSWIGAFHLNLSWNDPVPGLRELLYWVKSRLRRKLPW